MLKTGFKSFIYSFSVSLFVIISTNKVFCHEKNTSSPDLNIRNKTIALYLTSTTPSRAPVKKITLSYLQDLEKLQTDTNHSPQEEVIVASTLEAMDIPLESHPFR